MLSESRRYSTALLALLLGACIVRFWLFLLPESFWLDETVTAFVLRHGAGHPSLAAGPRLDQTIYYWLPRASQAILGFSEFSLRLPSLIATFVSLFLTGRIAARIIHPDAVWFAVFLCFIPHEFARQATDARPYGLGTAVALAAVWFLIRWLDKGRWFDGLLFAVAAAALVRVHLIYWPFYALFLLYSGIRWWRKETAVTLPVGLGVFAVIAASLAPMIPITLSLFGEARQHVVVAPPTWGNIVSGLQLPLLAALGAASWFAANFLFRAPRENNAIALSGVALLTMWWLWQPLCLLAVSLIAGTPVFLPRYFSLAIPGMMLAGAAAVGYFLPARMWKPAAIVLATGALLSGFLKESFPPTRNSHWREAAQAVNVVVRNADIPVICPSPFVEARTPAWSSEYKLPGFLYAHLDTYPIHAASFLLPARAEPAGQTYAKRLVGDRLIPARRFLVYGGTFGVSLWTDWFMAQPEFARWHNFQIGKFGEVEIVEFVPN